MHPGMVVRAMFYPIWLSRIEVTLLVQVFTIKAKTQRYCRS
jgi:hypothetical protein